MKRHKAIATVDRALTMASDHVSGSRDPSLPNYMDSQVERFLETLKQMKASLESPDADWVSQKYMCMAIADGWPFESELGKLICEAEEEYHSLRASPQS